ncbi:MAG: hypothetical protein GDA50_07250 [Alphaproteobacteria bacterium GM202ARS2]|nr:hypothetical protein [Alphaproteobacteria bacterium GM202ARS2]
MTTCRKIVEEVIHGKRRLVVDRGGDIEKEYRNKIRISNKPTIGRVFMTWLYRESWGSVVRVSITKEGDNVYKQFPKDEALKKFDPSDRKFIAVACAHGGKPEVMQATDSKWWAFRDVFRRLGIRVVFLCEDYVKEKYRTKQR